MDPITLGLTTLGTGLFSGMSNIAKKKLPKMSLNDLYAEGFSFMNPEKIKADNERMVSNSINDMRNNALRMNASKGLITPMNHNTESPLWDNLLKANMGVDEAARKEHNDMAKYIFDYNRKVDSANDSQPDFLDGFLQGGLSGAGLYSSFLGKDIGGDVTLDELRKVNAIKNYLESQENESGNINNSNNYNNQEMDNLNAIYSGGNKLNINDIYGGGAGQEMQNMKGMNMPDMGMQNMEMPGMSNTANPEQGGGYGDPVIAGIPLSGMMQMPKDVLIKIIFMQDKKLKEVLTDTVPTMLSPGEKVINKEAAGMADGQLDMLNMQGLNQRNNTNIQVKDTYTFDEIITIQKQNPELYNYIVQQAAQGKIKIE